jgi:hypothetical protein
MQMQVSVMVHSKIDVDYIDDLFVSICISPFLLQLSSFNTCFNKDHHSIQR